MADSRPFDLVVTCPSTSGNQDVTLLRAMRSIRPNVRFIILTEQSTPADVIASIRERAFSCFTTPITLEVFGHMVPQCNRRWVGRWHQGGVGDTGVDLHTGAL